MSSVDDDEASVVKFSCTVNIRREGCAGSVWL